MLDRDFHYTQLKKRLNSVPVVAILGPRQCGKTTVAKSFSSSLYLDLENPEDLALLENPEQTFKGLKGLIVIDEIQRRPELFPFLRSFVDRHPKVKILILGSSSRDLIQQSSESLAGRISYYHLSGFAPGEIQPEKHDLLWLRGGFPRSFLAKTAETSSQWREDYIRTFLERDIPRLGLQIPAQTLRRFWNLLAHYNGQILNYSEIGKNFGISDTTVKKYLDILAGTFMVEILAPWHANISKRQVKSPKFYFRDTGLFHHLSRIQSRKDLLAHPKLGCSWETQVLNAIRFKYDGELYFWNTQAEAEIDFLIPTKKGLVGIEAKFSDAPRITPSMRHALKDLNLQRIEVVYPGTKSYFLADNIQVLPLAQFSVSKN
jgi:uncharacterized protein